MLGLINTAASQCLDTKIVISGYSQGAQLVHNAAAKLTAAVTARIAAGMPFPISSVYNPCSYILRSRPLRRPRPRWDDDSARGGNCPGSPGLFLLSRRRYVPPLLCAACSI